MIRHSPDRDFLQDPIFAEFERVASLHPNRAALLGLDERLTYRDVWSRARQLSFGISSRVPVGRSVAVLLPNSPASMIAIVACLAAGRTCVVLNSEHPQERNRVILESAGSHTAIVAEGEAHLTPASMASLTLRESPVSQPDQYTPDPRPASLDDPALVLYTSGSTGAPKGIALSQNCILLRAGNYMIGSALNRELDCLLSLGTLATIGGVISGMMALLGGIPQLILPVKAAGARNILAFIQRQHVTLLWGVPSVLRSLFDLEGASQCVGSVRQIRTYGEPVLASDVELWRTVVRHDCEIGVIYAQTETSIASWFVPREFKGDTAALPGGYLMPDVDAIIVDEDGNAVPEGEAGELIVRCRHVALGEWQKERCVPGRFEADPLNPGLRRLRTGDLVRMRPDGLLQVLGRCDRQVKVRGNRVELSEIEAALRRVPGVTDAAVLARPTDGHVRLLAFVAAPGMEQEFVRGSAYLILRQSLPSYMQPDAIVALDQLPRLPEGKVDTQRLLAIQVPLQTACSDGSWIAASPAHRAVEKAWLRILDRHSLENGTRFDEAGGDSLLLIQFVFHLETEVGAALPLEVFHEAGTPNEYARKLNAFLNKESARSAAPLVLLFPGLGGDDPQMTRFRVPFENKLQVVTMEYPDWTEVARRGFSFDDLVAQLVQQIEGMSPGGPLRMAGYSMGGPLAYQAARALHASGRSVACLGILDAPAFESSSQQPVSSRPRRIAAKPFDRLREGLASVLAKILTRPEARRLLRSLIGLRQTTLPFNFALYLHRKINMQLRLRMFQTWRKTILPPTERFSAPTFLFRTEDHLASQGEDLGWSEYCADLTILPVAGSHYTMMEREHNHGLTIKFVDTMVHASVHALLQDSEYEKVSALTL